MLMAEIDDNARVRLTRRVRLQIDQTTGKMVLLFPEGIVELNETAQEILTRCDGRKPGQHCRGLGRRVRDRSCNACCRCSRNRGGFAAPQTGGALMSVPRPYAFLVELTYRCPLHCPYCSN